MTTLGEYVLAEKNGVWQETLVAALGVLGHKPQTARQAISRSANAGWLQAERLGRRSRIHLTDRARSMLITGADRIYRFGEPRSWSGEWLLINLSVPEQRREVRHQLRTQLAWAGFGSLGAGLWLSPHVEREAELRESLAESSVAAARSFHARLGSIGDPQQLLADAWDLQTVDEVYRAFIVSFDRLKPKTPEAMFQAQTLLVHEWRKFPFLDPDLPEQMLPAGWPRTRAHDVFQERHSQWHAEAQSYFSTLEAISSRDASGRAAA